MYNNRHYHTNRRINHRVMHDIQSSAAGRGKPRTLNGGFDLLFGVMRQSTQHWLRQDNQRLPNPLDKRPLLLYWFESSSKLSDTSLGKVFFGLISFFTCGGALEQRAAPLAWPPPDLQPVLGLVRSFVPPAAVSDGLGTPVAALQQRASVRR